MSKIMQGNWRFMQVVSPEIELRHDLLIILMKSLMVSLRNYECSAKHMLRRHISRDARLAGRIKDTVFSWLHLVYLDFAFPLIAIQLTLPMKLLISFVDATG